jgi:hypothetical protein
MCRKFKNTLNGNARKEKEVVEEYRYKKRKEIEKTPTNG